MSIKKSNIDFLRQILDANLKGFDEGAYTEAIEFLDSIEEDISDLKREIDDEKDEVRLLELKNNDLQNEINDAEANKREYTIQAGIGTICWEADNIQLQSLMETLGVKVRKHTPLKIEEVLSSL